MSIELTFLLYGDLNTKQKISNLTFSPLQQMYIAEVLQDPNSEGGSGSGEEDGQGSSQDEEIINVENGLNEDFQSGEDSLIENEVRH